jgi:hypothetical protein
MDYHVVANEGLFYIRQNDHLQEQTLKKMFQNLEKLKELPDRHQDVVSKMEQLTANFSRLQTSETIIDNVGDNLGGIIRAELTGTLVPTLKMCLDQYSSKYDGQLKALHQAIDKMTLEFQTTVETRSQRVQDLRTETEAKEQSNDTAEDAPENGRSSASLKELVGATAYDINNLSESRDLEQESLDWGMLPRKRVLVKKKNWHFQWLGSNLRVTIKTLATGNTKILSRRRVQVSVQFQTSPAILSRCGISMLFSTGPDHRGYHPICPSIRVFGVIPGDSPCARAICTGDIPALQVLFGYGEAQPSDQWSNGMTLLHVSLTQAFIFLALAEIGKFRWQPFSLIRISALS